MDISLLISKTRKVEAIEAVVLRGQGLRTGSTNKDPESFEDLIIDTL